MNLAKMHSPANFAGGFACRCLLLVVFSSVFTIMTPSFALEMITDGTGYTEESAVHAALSRAIEQSAATNLSRVLHAPKGTCIPEKMLNDSKAYIKTYSILESTKEFGLIKVKVRADVEMGKLGNDLAAQNLLYDLQNKPRLMVILDERINNQEDVGKIVTGKIVTSFLEHHFKVVDPEQLKAAAEIRKACAGEDKVLADLAFANGADLMVRGAVNVVNGSPEVVYGTPFYPVSIQMNARIVRADNAEIVATLSMNSSQKSRDELSAEQAGLEACGGKLADSLLGKLMEFWQNETYSTQTIDLEVSGLSQDEISLFQKTISEPVFVKAVRLRYQEGSTFLFEVDINGSIHDVGEALFSQKVFRCVVSTITPSRIAATLEGSIRSKALSGDSALKICDFQIQNIFPSRLRFYENNPIMRIKLRNGIESLDKITIHATMPEFSAYPADTVLTTIGPGEEMEIALNLPLSYGRVLANDETKQIYGQAIVSYVQMGKAVKRSLITPLRIYDKNAMDWNELNSIGGFITDRDPAVDGLAKMAIHALENSCDETKADFFNALAVFQALDALGIKYVKNPVILPGELSYDRVQYPWETLSSLTGNCSDLAVLYAALLSAIGIETALILYPDHALVMVNTGAYEKNRISISADTSQTVCYNGTIWIPVETTLIPKGFMDAWAAAAQEFHRTAAAGEKIDIIDITDAWKHYPPISITNVLTLKKIPNLSDVVAGEKALYLTQVKNGYAQAIQYLEQKAPNDAVSANSLGILYAKNGDYQKACELFTRARDGAPSSYAAANNYACALMLSGNETGAIALLEKIGRLDSLGRIALNKALCCYIAAEDKDGVRKFESAIREVYVAMPEKEKLPDFLGFAINDNNEARGAEDHAIEEKQKINLRRLKELIKRSIASEPLPDSTRDTTDKKISVLPFGGIRGADPQQIAKLADLFFWFDKI